MRKIVKKLLSLTTLITLIILSAFSGCVVLGTSGSHSLNSSNTDTSSGLGSSSSVSQTEWVEPTDDETATSLIANNYTPNSQQIGLYATGLLDAKLTNGSDKISPPENTSFCSVITYTVRPNKGNSRGYYYANFLNLSEWLQEPNTVQTNPCPDELYEKYKDVDWTKAYISFWMYNASDVTAAVYGTDTDFDNPNTPEKETMPTNKTESAGKKIWSLQPKAWTRIKLSLKTYCDITSDVIATGEYNIKLWLHFIDDRVTTANCTGNETWTFYMTGFEFI